MKVCIFVCVFVFVYKIKDNNFDNKSKKVKLFLHKQIVLFPLLVNTQIFKTGVLRCHFLGEFQ